MIQKSLRADMLMLITAAIWGGAFVAQKTSMEYIGPFLYSGLRFVLAAFFILPLVLRSRGGNDQEPLFNKGTLFGGVIMGLALTIGLNFQQVGLMYTSATNAGFITGLYVIIVPIFGLFFYHKTGFGTWIGAVLAVVGMLLLSVGETYQVASGDWLQLIGAFAWAAHVLCVGYFSGKQNAIRLAFVQFVTCSIFSILLAVVFEPINLNAIISAGPQLLYGGILAGGVGFTLQVIAQKNAIASHAAIILSLEAVFAAIAGSIFLDEVLSPRGYFGCFLMFAGMLVTELWPVQKITVTNT